MAACGHTSAHWLHWMQTLESQTGISSARLRFSHFAVDIGHVPSTGNALTGSRSPFPARITAVTFCTKSGASSETSGGRLCPAVTLAGTGISCRLRQRLIDDLAVPAHDLGAPLAVRLLDGLLDVLDRVVGRQQAGDLEETRLHDRVDARPHPGALRQLVGVDREEADLPLDDLLLQLLRQVIPDLGRGKRRVQQERGAVRRVLEHVDLVHELELVARDEAGAIHEVGRTDRLLAGAQVRDRDGAGLLRVVDEVPLRVQLRLLPEDLDRILVGPDRAVGAEPVEHRRRHVRRLGPERRIPRDRRMRHVVDDAEGEVTLGIRLAELVERGLDHRRREFLRRQAVAARR